MRRWQCAQRRRRGCDGGERGAGRGAQLLKWILGKVKQRGGEVDSNKQYASEVLAILMQHSESNQAALGALGGIDVILQAIAYYKNRRAPLPPCGALHA